MPTYDYLCPNGDRFEVIHSVTADGPTTCPVCGAAPVRKAFTAPTIHFKGSGWAKKDRSSASRSASRAASSGSEAGADAAAKDATSPTTPDKGSDSASGTAKETGAKAAGKVGSGEPKSASGSTGGSAPPAAD